jgi:succinate-semialdehyde dehydrogenase/glutarate-semialdehyde dehydrogenase
MTEPVHLNETDIVMTTSTSTELLSPAPRRLPVVRQLYIAGRWVDAASDDTFDATDPATGEILGAVASAGPDDATRALDAAATAFRAWAALSGSERSAYLLRLRDLLRQNLDHIAAVMTSEQGKPLAEAKGELAGCLDYLEWFAEEAKRLYGDVVGGLSTAKRQLVVHRPVGPVVAITPWNFPALLIIRKAAAALAAGCSVVVKPAEQTPLTALAIFESVAEAGFPEGVVNLILTGSPVEVGEALLSHRHLAHLTFTGSTEVGKLLASRCAERMRGFSMELGGHAPFIVFPDADLDQAAADLNLIKFRNAGQTCVNPNRVFVHRAVRDDFHRRFLALAKKQRVGNGFDPATTVGPLIDAAALDKVQRHLSDAVSKGATVLLGGSRDHSAGAGIFFEPTVLDGVTEDMMIFREETFGPIAPIISFDDRDDIWAMANDSAYGLIAYVYTNDLETAFEAFEHLDYGVIGVNDPRPGNAQTPFGGVKDSGTAREGGREGLYDFLTTHTVSIGSHGRRAR